MVRFRTLTGYLLEVSNPKTRGGDNRGRTGGLTEEEVTVELTRPLPSNIPQLSSVMLQSNNVYRCCSMLER